MAEFSLTFTEVSRKTEALREQNAQLLRQIRNLTETENCLNGMWEGESRAAFHRVFLADTEKMMLFHRTIEQYTQTLEQINSRYLTAEQRTMEIAGRS